MAEYDRLLFEFANARVALGTYDKARTRKALRGISGKRLHVRVFAIGALAKAASVSTPTVRYYEEIGLLPRAQRTAGGQRSYDEADLNRLAFIKQFRDFGFGIEQVRTLLDLSISPTAIAPRRATSRRFILMRCAGSPSSCAASKSGWKASSRAATSPVLAVRVRIA